MGSTAYLPLVKSTYVSQFSPTTAYGNNAYLVHQVGAENSKKKELLIQLNYSSLPAGIIAITSATFTNVQEDVEYNGGAALRSNWRVIDAAWNANSVTWNTKPALGPLATDPGESNLFLGPSDEGISNPYEYPTNFAEITGPINAIREHVLNGRTNYGISLDPGTNSGAGFFKLWTFNRGELHQANMKVEYNRNPNKPSSLSPAGETASPKQITTLTPSLIWQFSDPDGDGQSAYQLIIYDADTNAIVKDTGKVTTVGNIYSVPAATLAWNKKYYWKVRTWDNDPTTQGVSVYSDSEYFYTNQTPTAALTSPTGTSGAPSIFSGSNTPTFTWTYSDATTDTQKAFQIQILDGSTVVFDSGTVNSNETEYTVPTSANLAYDKTYNVQIRVKDTLGDTFGAYSTKTYFHLNRAPSATVSNPAGSATIPDVLTDSLTPTLSWIFTDQDGTDTQGGYQVQILLNGNSLIHDSGQVSSSTKSYLVPAGVLQNGNTYGWKVRVRDQHGLWGDWSGQGVFYNNQTPTIPVPDQKGTQVSPFLVRDDLTPTFTWDFNDTEDDSQAAFQFKLYNEAGTQLLDSGIVVSGTKSYTIPLVYKLTYGLKYSYQVKVRDQEGVWSSYCNKEWLQPIVAAPTGLSITVDNLRAQFILNWSDSLAEGLQGYNVYRKTEPGGSFAKINGSLLTSSNYTDSSIVSGTTYSYAIEAYVSDTQVSALSSVVSAAASFSAWFIGAYKFDGAMKFSESLSRNRTVRNTLTRRVVQDKGFNTEDMELEIMLVDDDYSTARFKRNSIMDELKKTTVLALKDPFGGQWNISPGDVSFDQLTGIGKAGWIMKITFTEV